MSKPMINPGEASAVRRVLPRFFLIAALPGLAVILAGCADRPAVGRPAHAVSRWEVRLEVDPGARAGDSRDCPLGAGVPLREGQARDVGGLAVVDDAGRPVPAFFTVRRRYDDGSIQWLWIDFRASADRDSYRLVYPGENPLPEPGVRAVETDGTVTVDNGEIIIEWRRDGAVPVTVRQAAAGGREFSAGDGAGIYLVAQDGRRAVMGGPGAELEWTMETVNPLRAVVLVEGWYACLESGEPLARGRVRYHVHWKEPSVRLEHTFIVTRGNDEVTYREIGIHWPGPTDEGGGRAHFGRVGAGPLEVALPGDGGQAWIYQEQYPVYYRRESLYRAGRDGGEIDRGAEAAGWVALENGNAGILLSVRDFAPQFPKELSASAAGLTAKLWSGRSGRVLDYRPATLVEDWWGEWLDRNLETYVAERLLPGHLRTVEGWKEENPDNTGVARSHEILVSFGAPGRSETEKERVHRHFQAAPLVYPDPRWTCRVGPRTFWPMAAKGEAGPEYDDVERLISTWIDQYMIPDRLFPMTGWYDWGRLPLDRYAADRTEEGDRVWAHLFRPGIVNRYLFNRYLMIAWARSGDRRYYEAAARLNRFLRDHYFIHWGPRRGFISQGAVALPIAWGGGSLRPGVDSENMTGLALEYLFLGREASRDVLLAHREALLDNFRADHRFTGTTPDMIMAGLVGIWRVTGDEELAETIGRLFRLYTDPEGPGGMSAGFFANWEGSHYANPLYKLLRKSMAAMEYHLVFGDGHSRRVVTAAAREIAARYGEGSEPLGYCNVSGAVGGYARLMGGGPETLETAAYQVETARNLFAAFESLPEEERGVERWKSRANFSMSSYEASFVFPELGLLTGRQTRRGDDIHIRLGFTVSGAAAPFFSIPVALGVVSGVLEPEILEK